MKKIIYLFVFLSILFVPNGVYAQEYDEFPYDPQQVEELDFPMVPIALEYKEYYFVQENEQTYEYIVVYQLPYRLSERIINGISHDDYYLLLNDIIFVELFYRGQYVQNTVRGSYILEDIITTTDETYFYYRVTISKSKVDSNYIDNDITLFFTRDSKMYIDIDEDEIYQLGFNNGVKSITNKYTSYVFKWTLPFVTLVIISGIYFGLKKEWFKK